jgi:hypothetical protein
VFSCKDNVLRYADHGTVRWTKKLDGALESWYGPRSSFIGIMDRTGTVYFIDRPQQGLGTHIHAISSTAEELWTVKESGFSIDSINLDSIGRAYLMGRYRLVCVSE